MFAARQHHHNGRCDHHVWRRAARPPRAEPRGCARSPAEPPPAIPMRTSRRGMASSASAIMPGCDLAGLMAARAIGDCPDAKVRPIHIGVFVVLAFGTGVRRCQERNAVGDHDALSVRLRAAARAIEHGCIGCRIRQARQRQARGSDTRRPHRSTTPFVTLGTRSAGRKVGRHGRISCGAASCSRRRQAGGLAAVEPRPRRTTRPGIPPRAMRRRSAENSDRPCQRLATSARVQQGAAQSGRQREAPDRRFQIRRQPSVTHASTGCRAITDCSQSCQRIGELAGQTGADEIATCRQLAVKAGVTPPAGC